jgi:hypothetical protein
MDTKNADVLNTTNATEILEYLMAAKKNTQCAAVNKPTAAKRAISLVEAITWILRINTMSNMVRTAITTRHHTKGTADNEISLPRMPVSPHTNTMA